MTHLYRQAQEAIMQNPVGVKVEDRSLTIAEWVRVKILRQPDPRIHHVAVTITVFDYSDPRLFGDPDE